MTAAIWIVVACTAIGAITALVQAILSLVTVRHNGAILRQQAEENAQQRDFARRLMSRFCAASNIQAEAFVLQQEQRESTNNEERRLEEAGEEQETHYLR